MKNIFSLIFPAMLAATAGALCANATNAMAESAAATQSATQPANDDNQALAPALQKAIAQLSSDDYAMRQQAMQAINDAMAAQARQILKVNDPEAQSRLAEVMQRNAGLSLWVAEMLALQPEQRKSMLQWGLEPTHVGLVAEAYSPASSQRVQAARDLAKLPEKQASDLLAHLLSDPERVVYLAAMEGLWDRELTAHMVDVLWDRAISSSLEQYMGMQQTQEVVRFRGQELPRSPNSGGLMERVQDNDVATQVLIHSKSPLAMKKIETVLNEAVNNQNANQMLLWPYTVPSRNMYRLIESLQPKGCVAALYKLATGPVTQNQNNNFNNMQTHWSNRTAPLAVLVKITGQRLEDYKLKRFQQMGDIWCTPTEQDENDDLKKLQDWWKDHHQEYEPAATQAAGSPPPASQPAATPARGMPQRLTQPDPPFASQPATPH